VSDGQNGQKPTILHAFFGRSVAAVGTLFQPFAIKDGDEASPVGDQARVLELLKCRRHARTADAKHDGKKLMREGEFAFDAIRRHQQPAGQAFLWLGSLASAACEV
jgi:hypothetical protein